MSLNSFEISCVRSFHAKEVPPPAKTADPAALIRYGIWILLRISQRIRALRPSLNGITTALKSDGTPVTQIEIEIEDMVRESLSLLPDGISFISEEAGGTLPSNGLAIVLDPIDGTRSFLTQSDNFSTSLAFYNNGIPIIGMIINPTTGDLGYVIAGEKTRLIQFSVFGEGNFAATLPSYSHSSRHPCLVHVHPSRAAMKILGHLDAMWKNGAVQFIKFSGGSPAYALLEAAKGHFIYINLWDHRPAAPFDLAAGILLVRGSGGEVRDRNGQPIRCDHHAGPFLAALPKDEWAEAIDNLLEILRNNVRS